MALFKKNKANAASDNDTEIKQTENPEQPSQEVTQEHNELQACQQELAQLKDRFIRSNADFENYKRRMERDRLLWGDTVQMAVLADLLPLVDDIDRAVAQLQKEEKKSELQAWLEGVELISKALTKTLAKYEVKEMESYTDFDPELHEALAQIDSPDHQSGQIVEVFQKGFLYKDQVLRHAKVSVAK